MRQDKQKAIQLRKQGKSYQEIKATLNVPKSTLSDWLSNHKWSNLIKHHLTLQNNNHSTIRLRELNKIKGKNLAKIYKEAQVEARKEFEQLKWLPLFIAGICIFWGEGDKISKNQVRIANVDPRLIKIFVSFLKRVCGIPKEKIRGYILTYPDLNAKECIDFWAKESRLGLENFNKCIIIKGKHKTRRLSYGVCNITVSNSYLNRKIHTWLKLLSNELIYKYNLRV